MVKDYSDNEKGNPLILVVLLGVFSILGVCFCVVVWGVIVLCVYDYYFWGWGGQV